MILYGHDTEPLWLTQGVKQGNKFFSKRNHLKLLPIRMQLIASTVLYFHQRSWHQSEQV